MHFLGIIAFTQISVNFLPSIQIPELFIETDCTNASAAEVEKTITKPVESITSTVDGVSKISSVSRDGESLVTLKLAWGTDVNYAMLEVREKLDELKASLPENAGRSTIYKIDPSTESIMTLAVNLPSTEDTTTPGVSFRRSSRLRNPMLFAKKISPPPERRSK